MKIVIDIDDDRYEKIINNEVYAPLDICVALYNGKPLPEHHGRLIDEKELSNHLKECLFETALNNTGYKTECNKVFEDIADNRIDIWIKDAPAIIEGSESK